MANDKIIIPIKIGQSRDNFKYQNFEKLVKVRTIKTYFDWEEGLISIPENTNIETLLNKIQKAAETDVVKFRPGYFAVYSAMHCEDIVSNADLKEGIFFRNSVLFKDKDTFYWSMAPRIEIKEQNDFILQEKNGKTKIIDLPEKKGRLDFGPYIDRFPNYFLIDIAKKNSEEFKDISSKITNFLEKKFEYSSGFEWKKKSERAAKKIQNFTLNHLPELTDLYTNKEKEYKAVEFAEINKFKTNHFFCGASSGISFVNTTKKGQPKIYSIYGYSTHSNYESLYVKEATDAESRVLWYNKIPKLPHTKEANLKRIYLTEISDYITLHAQKRI